MNAAPSEDSRSLAITLASGHPEALLPCPLCASSVKGRNLATHVERTHAGASAETQSPSGAPKWRGVDVGSRRALVVLAIAVWVTLFLLIRFAGVRDDPSVAVLVVLGLLAFVPVLLSAAGLLSATIELDGTTLRLRFGLGLVAREVRVSAPLETGGLRATRSSALGTHAEAPETAPSMEVAAGRYLRARDGSRSITVGAAKGTGLEKHWAPAGLRAAGPARRRDITVDRTAMAQLEHHLAARGLLAPREP